METHFSNKVWMATWTGCTSREFRWWILRLCTIKKQILFYHKMLLQVPSLLLVDDRLPLLAGKHSRRNVCQTKIVRYKYLLTASFAGSVSMLRKGQSTSSLCLLKNTAVACTTSAVRVRHCGGCLGATDNHARGPPCSLAIRDLAIHCISLGSTLHPRMNWLNSVSTYYTQHKHFTQFVCLLELVIAYIRENLLRWLGARSTEGNFLI